MFYLNVKTIFLSVDNDLTNDSTSKLSQLLVRYITLLEMLDLFGIMNDKTFVASRRIR